MTANPLDEFGPYPVSGEVTAEKLLRYETVAAYVQEIYTHDLLKDAYPTEPGSPEWQRYLESATTLAARFGLAFLLRQVIEHIPGHADDIADRLHGMWLDGGCIPEFLHDWLTEAGIDPDQVAHAATEVLERQRTAQATAGDAS